MDHLPPPGPLNMLGLKINPDTYRYLWEQMLEAVQQVHDKNFIHNDIKPANFLLGGYRKYAYVYY